MNLNSIKELYNNGEMSKVEFISEMKKFHDVLFDYSNNLLETEIAGVEIIDNKVIFTTRETNYHSGDCRFIVDTRDPRVVPIEAFNFGCYELEDSRMMFDLMKHQKIIFDIGANIGWYSIHIANTFEESMIYAFEPIPETFEKLGKNHELNKVSNLFIENIALSNFKGELNFFYSPYQTGAASSKNILGIEDLKELTCPTTTVDLYIKDKNIKGLDFIKCDVEGAEFFVLQGASESIQSYKPIVFAEMLRKWSKKFDYHPNDIVDFMKNMGYGCFVNRALKLFQIEEIDDNTLETNFFFLNLEKHEFLIEKYR